MTPEPGGDMTTDLTFTNEDFERWRNERRAAEAPVVTFTVWEPVYGDPRKELVATDIRGRLFPFVHTYTEFETRPLTGWLLCAIGAHKWTEFGDCERNSLHVKTRPEDWLIGVGHLMSGTDWVDSPYGRAHAARRAKKVRDGKELQAELAPYFTNPDDVPSEQLCRDAAANGWADTLRAVVRERTEAPR